jgi:hypothetical protein
MLTPPPAGPARTSPTFRCPRCSGPRFGTSCDVDAQGRFVRVREYQCHNARDGGEPDRLDTSAGRFTRPGVLDCGWRGTAGECGMGPNVEDAK